MRKYLGAFKRWKVWATQHRMVSLPAKDYQVALYLQSLGERSQSKSAVKEACNAIAWAHSTAGIPTPTASPFLKATLDGMQQKLARPTVKKVPITTAMLEEMVKDTRNNCSLSDLRLTTACLLAYAGLLRSNELVNMKPCDFKIQDGQTDFTFTTQQLCKEPYTYVATSCTYGFVPLASVVGYSS